MSTEEPGGIPAGQDIGASGESEQGGATREAPASELVTRSAQVAESSYVGPRSADLG